MFRMKSKIKQKIKRHVGCEKRHNTCKKNEMLVIAQNGNRYRTTKQVKQLEISKTQKG